MIVCSGKIIQAFLLLAVTGQVVNSENIKRYIVMVQSQTLPFTGVSGAIRSLKESFFHYVWQFQYFDTTDLRTDEGEAVQVFATGLGNTHSGPDFRDARVQIGDMVWVGCVEIHIYGSGWADHRHEQDPAYENVILHVVWENDRPARRADGSRIPTIVLRDRIQEDLLFRYRRFMNSPEHVPCSSSLERVPTVVRLSMLDRAFAGRLEAKAQGVASMQHRNTDNWEETCYQLLARSFGFKINSEPFQQLALCLPYRVLLKHADRPVQLEALLLGQAGFLEPRRGEVLDEYTGQLRKEYTLLSRKYSLGPGQLGRAQWKFLRLRPANFPTVRLAQFAGLLAQRKNIFSSILGAASVAALRALFRVEQSAYWQQHYHPGRRSREDVSTLGDASIDAILINAVVPLLVAYGKSHDEPLFVDRAIAILEEIPAETNSVTRRWASLGWPAETALDSQGFLELYNNFCLKRRCLDCSIGASLLKPSQA